MSSNPVYRVLFWVGVLAAVILAGLVAADEQRDLERERRELEGEWSPVTAGPPVTWQAGP